MTDLTLLTRIFIIFEIYFILLRMSNNKNSITEM